MVSSSNIFPQSKESQKGEDSFHQEMMTRTLMAVERLEWRNLGS